MKLNKLNFILLLVPFAINAQNSNLTDKEKQEIKNNEILHQMGLPAPGDGIKIIPRSLIGIPEEELKKGKLEEESIAQYGYINENSIRPLELLSKNKLAQFSQSNKISDTHMRHNASQLKLAFDFKGVPKDLVTNYIGVAPGGGFHESGWSGAAEFFDTDFSSCAYNQLNVKITHFSPVLAIESVTYDINNKPSIKEIRGSIDSGFIYNIKWFDDDYNNELECANNNYSEDIYKKVIELAIQIDNYKK